MQAKLHGPGLDFPRPSLDGRRQWDGCLLGRGWAAPDAVDESDCTGIVPSVLNTIPLEVMSSCQREGRRSLVEPQFSYCCLRGSDQATFGTPGCGCAWGCMVLHDTFLLLCVFSASLYTSLVVLCS